MTTTDTVPAGQPDGQPTPQHVNGLPVVAMISLPDVPGMLPGRHVVIVRDDHKTPGREYILWTVYPHGGTWEVTGSGRHDIGWDRALDLMIERGRTRV